MNNNQIVCSIILSLCHSSSNTHLNNLKGTRQLIENNMETMSTCPLHYKNLCSSQNMCTKATGQNGPITFHVTVVITVMNGKVLDCNVGQDLRPPCANVLTIVLNLLSL